MTLFDNTYSTCKPGSADWYLKTSETHLDYDDDRVGDAKNATRWFAGRRFSMHPAGQFFRSTTSGAQASCIHFVDVDAQVSISRCPYYLEYAPNYDPDLYRRVTLSKRASSHAGGAYSDITTRSGAFEYMPTTRWRTGRSRLCLSAGSPANLGRRGFSATINWNGVSDDYYWQDLSSRLLQTSQVQLPGRLCSATPAPGCRPACRSCATRPCSRSEQPDFPPLLPGAAAEHAGLQAERVQDGCFAIGQFRASPMSMRPRCRVTGWCSTRSCRCPSCIRPSRSRPRSACT